MAFKLSERGRTAKHKKQPWNADSGATISCTNNINIFETIDEVSPNRPVQVASGHIIQPTLKGSVRMHMVADDGSPYSILLHGVYYSPHFSCQLLSVDEMYKQHKFTTVFRGRRAHFITPDGVCIPIQRDSRNRYMLHVNSVVDADPLLWHRRLMHAGTDAMRRMGKCCIPSLHGCKFDFSKCDACLQGGSKRLSKGNFGKRGSFRPQESFKKHKTNRFTYFGERIACDLCGPMPRGVHGEKYAIIFHDSATKYYKVYSLRDKEKSTVLEAFQRFTREHQDLLTRGIGTFWTDNGGELQNADMDAFCEEICVKRNWTVPYSSWQNPYAERAWGVILRPTRTALLDAGVEERFWPYFIEQAALIHNVLCDDDCKSPYERVHGEKFDYNKLHAMGCLCYYILPERDRGSKLSPRAMRAIYLGVDHERQGHYVYVPGLQRITTSYHLVFNEYRNYDKAFDKRVTFEQDRADTKSHEPVGRAGRHYIETRDDENAQLRDNNVQRNADADERRPIPLQQDLPLHPADDPAHGEPNDENTRGYWSENHCSNPSCTYPIGHDGPCSKDNSRLFRMRPRTRIQYGRSVYAQCCKSDACAFHDDHCGECIDDDGERLHESVDAVDAGVQYGEPGKFQRSVVDDDWDSIMDLDPMASISAVVDDVQNEVFQVDPALFSDVPCPVHYEDAIKSPLATRWHDSMRNEITALLKNGTWVYVSRNDPRLRGRKATKSRWVYAIKYNRDGTIEKFKSRFVVCGYSQRQGIDYDRAFSATLRGTTFRTMLAIAAGQKLRLMQIDVSNAFTQADMDDAEVFVEPPKGFEEYETVKGKKVSKLLYLKKALYGTKQASRLWQAALQRFLLQECSLTFKQSPSDPCVFNYQHGDTHIIVGIYVDDLIVAYRGNEAFSKFNDEFHKRFTATEAKKLSWFLGMAIDQHEDYSVHISHELSIQKMADKFIPNNQVTRECPPTDLFNKLDRAQSDVDRAKAKEFLYASLVGALLYVSVTSRPDIAFHTSILAKFLSDPSPDCVKASIALLQYLQSTKKKRLYFSGKPQVYDGLEVHRSDIEKNHGFTAFSDSSWGNQYPYPMFGYSVYLYGSLISFASKQLKTVAFSSCEAEYAAASYACKEVEFIRNICADMGVVLQGRLVLALDNTACITIAHDAGVSGRTKHFDRAIHYLRDLTQLRRVLPFYVETNSQLADGFTKSLDKSKFTKWCSALLH